MPAPQAQIQMLAAHQHSSKPHSSTQQQVPSKSHLDDLNNPSRPFILGNQPPGMDDTRDPAEHPQQDVDDDVGAAADFQEHRQRRDEEGQEVEQHVGLWRAQTWLVLVLSLI